MKIYGPLEEVSFEVLSSDPSNKPKGRVYFNSTDDKAKVSDGSSFDNFVTASQISGTSDNRADTAAIGAGVDFVDVTFSSALTTAVYSATVSMENDTDADPIHFSVLVKNKTKTGFRISLNGNTDTANYIANWKVQVDT